MYEAAWNLGLLLSVRMHGLTKDDPELAAIGYPGNGVDGPLRESFLHPDAVAALLSEANIEDFASRAQPTAEAANAPQGHNTAPLSHQASARFAVTRERAHCSTHSF